MNISPAISIIIITLNEENYLNSLLLDLKKQTFQNFEVIVSDANSTDKTRTIAKNFNAKIIDGGIPSIGRNNGAKISSGDILVFLDADVRIDPFYLEKSLKNFIDKKLDLGGTRFKILDNNISVIFNNVGNNFGKYLRQKSNYPALSGDSIWVKKKAFLKLNGFNENKKFGEDEDFGAKAVKNGLKYGLISYFHKSNGRRIKKIGIHKITFSFLYQTLGKIFKNNAFLEKAEKLYGNVITKPIR